MPANKLSLDFALLTSYCHRNTENKRRSADAPTAIVSPINLDPRIAPQCGVAPFCVAAGKEREGEEVGEDSDPACSTQLAGGRGELNIVTVHRADTPGGELMLRRWVFCVRRIKNILSGPRGACVESCVFILCCLDENKPGII